MLSKINFKTHSKFSEMECRKQDQNYVTISYSEQHFEDTFNSSEQSEAGGLGKVRRAMLLEVVPATLCACRRLALLESATMAAGAR